MANILNNLLLIVSILLISVVLLQSGKAESAAGALTGGGSEMFANRKERGMEATISRVTFILGAAFFIIAFISSPI